MLVANDMAAYYKPATIQTTMPPDLPEHAVATSRKVSSWPPAADRGLARKQSVNAPFHRCHDCFLIAHRRPQAGRVNQRQYPRRFAVDLVHQAIAFHAQEKPPAPGSHNGGRF